MIIVVNSFVSSYYVCDPWPTGLSRSSGILDGLPVLYCLKSENCRMISNDGRSLLSQCKMVGSATRRSTAGMRRASFFFREYGGGVGARRTAAEHTGSATGRFNSIGVGQNRTRLARRTYWSGRLGRGNDGRRSARHYRGLSTGSLGTAAMASVARAIYGLTV